MARPKDGSLTGESKLRWCPTLPDEKRGSRLYNKFADGNWIEDSGYVVRLLPDDNDGERHQRFVVQLPGRQTLLIANNLDISGRVPLGMGDRVHFRGIYEWNDLGGVVHWTHHDPHGDEEGGWIRYRKKVYR